MRSFLTCGKVSRWNRPQWPHVIEKYSATRTPASGLPKKRTSSARLVDTSNLANAKDGNSESERTAKTLWVRSLRRDTIGVDSGSDKSGFFLIFIFQFASCVSQKALFRTRIQTLLRKNKAQGLSVVINNSSSSVQSFLVLVKSCSILTWFRVTEMHDFFETLDWIHIGEKQSICPIRRSSG